MAIGYVAASNQYHRATTAAVTGYPATICAWYKPASIGAERNIVSLADEGGSDHWFRLVHFASNTMRAGRRGGTANVNQPASTSLMVAGEWHHHCAVYTSATSAAIFYDGADKQTSTTDSGTISGLDNTVLGQLYLDDGIVSTLGADGDLAEIGIWNVALTDDEAAALGKGACPLLIRPDSLVFHVHGIRTVTDEVGGLSLTAVNIPTTANHPRVYYRHAPTIAVKPEATSSITGTIAATFPSLSATAAGTRSGGDPSANVAATLPSLTALATGTVTTLGQPATESIPSVTPRVYVHGAGGIRIGGVRGAW